MDKAVLYIRIYFLGMPALALYNFGNAIYGAVGNTKKPLYYLAFAGVVNVGLNLFFVVACGMDVEGVALASIISQYISAVLIVGSLFRCGDIYGMKLPFLRLSGPEVKMILQIGLPSGFQNAIFQVANLFIQAGVNSFDATVVAGNAAAANADAMVYDMLAAFYTACGSFMGQNYGAGKKGNGVKKSYLVSLVYGVGLALAAGGLLAVFGHQFLSIFTSDEAVIRAGRYRLIIMSCSYFISVFMDGTIAASRALGKSLVPTIVVVMGSVVFRIIWVFTIFAYFRTIESLYLLYAFSWTITALTEMAYFRKVYHEKMAALEDV